MTGKKMSLTGKLDAMLLYSGLNVKLPFLTSENWILLQLLFASGVVLITGLLGISFWVGGLVMVLLILLQYI